MGSVQTVQQVATVVAGVADRERQCSVVVESSARLWDSFIWLFTLSFCTSYVAANLVCLFVR